MSFFSRLKNGWNLGIQSLQIIGKNKSLIVFPILSMFSMFLIFAAISAGSFALFGFDFDRVINTAESLDESSQILGYVVLFFYYLINFTVVIFFNVGLVFCARQVLNGEKPDIGEGISFAISRLGVIVSWAVLAATVGVLLKVIENKSESVGKFVIGLVGAGWALATFFVVPIIAYENLGPIDALKRSISIIKEKWGEALGANFGFGLFYMLGIFLIALPVGILGFMIHPIAGILLGILTFFLVTIVISSAETVFLAAAYQHVNEKTVEHYQTDLLDDMFYSK